MTYNIEADISVSNKQPTFTNNVSSSAAGAPLPGLITPPTDTNNFTAGGSLEGIGEEILSGNAQPFDILALQETTSNAKTIAPIVAALNLFYTAHNLRARYTNSTYQATESGGDAGDGNGPNAIIYDTLTVQLLASTPVDPSGGTGQLGSSSGEYREVMRYQFAPAGVAANTTNTFYIYVSHYKSGTGSSNEEYRDGEAQIVRSNMMTLPATARILHVGDFNTGDASEAMYATLTAPGTNQLFDPLNLSRSLTTNFDGSATTVNLTDSATELRYRDDYQMMTTNVYFGTGGGLKLISGTYHVFGNNGTIAYEGTVNSGGNTALTNLIANPPISKAQLLVDLTGASDHLPFVADYTIPLPAPIINNISLAGTNLTFSVVNSVTGAVFTVLAATNLVSPNWTPVATNLSGGGNFTFTATNVLSPAIPAEFFQLQEK